MTAPCLGCAILIHDGYGWAHDECALAEWPCYRAWLRRHPIPPEGHRRRAWRRRLDMMLQALTPDTVDVWLSMGDG